MGDILGALSLKDLGNVSGWFVAFALLVAFARAILKDRVVTRGRLDDALAEIVIQRATISQQAAALDKVADSLHVIEQYISALPSPRDSEHRYNRYAPRELGYERNDTAARGGVDRGGH